MGVQPIVQLWISCALLSLPALTRLQSASAAESEWTLSTKDTEIKIGIRNGADAILELHTTGRPWEWVQSPIEQPLPSAVTRAGRVSQLHWTYSGASQDPEHRTLTLTFKNASPALELRSYWKASPGFGPIEHWMALKNSSADRLGIGATPSLGLKSLALPSNHYVESTQVRRGGSNAQVSGGVLSRPVGQYWGVLVPSRPSDGGGGGSAAEDLESQVPFLNLQFDSSHGLYIGWKLWGVG